MKTALVEMLSSTQDFVCINDIDSTTMVLFRIYPPGVNAKMQCAKELNDPDGRTDLLHTNQRTMQIAHILDIWHRTHKRIDGRPTAHVSYCAECLSINQICRKKTDAVVCALELSHTDVAAPPEAVRWMIDCVRAARDVVLLLEPHLPAAIRDVSYDEQGRSMATVESKMDSAPQVMNW